MFRVALSFVLLALAVGAIAQKMPYGATPRFMLVMSPDVKKELKLTKDQDKLLQALTKDMAQGMDLSAMDLSNPMGALDPKLDPILNDAQKARLEELFIQANEGFALPDAKVAAALGLSDDQKASAKALGDEATEKLMEDAMNMRSAGDNNRLKAKKKEYSGKLLALLNPEQAKKFKELQGKPFKFR